MLNPVSVADLRLRPLIPAVVAIAAVTVAATNTNKRAPNRALFYFIIKLACETLVFMVVYLT